MAFADGGQYLPSHGRGQSGKRYDKTVIRIGIPKRNAKTYLFRRWLVRFPSGMCSPRCIPRASLTRFFRPLFGPFFEWSPGIALSHHPRFCCGILGAASWKALDSTNIPMITHSLPGDKQKRRLRRR